MYRTILVGNEEYKKTLHRCKTRDTAFINFRRIKKENEQVLFPRRFINSYGIRPIEYTIYVVKDHEDGDDMRLLRDRTGKTYWEKPLFGIWTALDSTKYQIEESFWVYGNKSNQRLYFEDILAILKYAENNNNLKEVIVVHNKLVVHSESFFGMVICKNKKDAQRLHHTLHKHIKKGEIEGYIFMGTATPATVSRMYGIIKENTDWSIEKIRRTSTRP